MAGAESPGEITFLEWLLGQRERTDPVAFYARAVVDDFRSGNRFRLADTAIPCRVNGMDICIYSDYCRDRGMHSSTANLLMLGNAMAVMEFNVSLLTGMLPCPGLDDTRSNCLREHVAACCDTLQGILQDIASDMRAEGMNPDE